MSAKVLSSSSVAAATRVRWASNFRGVTVNQSYGEVVRGLITSLLRSSDYSLGDVLRTLRGITDTQAALLHQINELYLDTLVPRLDVPFVMVQGRLDKVAPGDAALRYFDALVSTNKQFVWFENSAHTPQFDEPERFRNLLCQIRDAQLPSALSNINVNTDVSLSPQRINAKKSVHTENGGPQ